VSRCEWNPARLVGSTDPASAGDCPNDATVSVGATGRYHLCDSCAALRVFAVLKRRTPLNETAEQRLARAIAMTTEETVREMVEKAKEATMLPSVGTTYARMMIGIVETLAETPAGARAVINAMKKRADRRQKPAGAP
jgi:hypothetical protein